MFEYRQAILVRPVVEHIVKEEDRDVLRGIIIIPRRLWIKEILSFLRTQKCQLVPTSLAEEQKDSP